MYWLVFLRALPFLAIDAQTFSKRLGRGAVWSAAPSDSVGGAPLPIAAPRIVNGALLRYGPQGMRLACAGCRRGCVFLAGPMSGRLAPGTAFNYRYRAQRERFPFCITRAAPTLANAKAASHPERAVNGIMIGALVHSYEHEVVVVTTLV
jgi:hypothetical protein